MIRDGIIGLIMFYKGGRCFGENSRTICGRIDGNK
jgi:hypothetical protein